MRMGHNIRPGTIEMHTVPGIYTSLISACKMADDDYIMLLDKKGDNVYDNRTVGIVISEAAILSY